MCSRFYNVHENTAGRNHEHSLGSLLAFSIEMYLKINNFSTNFRLCYIHFVLPVNRKFHVFEMPWDFPTRNVDSHCIAACCHCVRMSRFIKLPISQYYFAPTKAHFTEILSFKPFPLLKLISEQGSFREFRLIIAHCFLDHFIIPYPI